MDNVLTIILPEINGTSLMPLTKTKPISTLVFAGRHLVIDFVLSNFINSGFFKIKVLTQYRSETLNHHIYKNWNISPVTGHYIDLVPPQMKKGTSWYNSGANAIYQNLDFLRRNCYKHVCIFRPDLIYKMNVKQMYEYHLKKTADVSLAVNYIPKKYAHEFGIIEINENHKIVGYEHKPQNPKTVPGKPNLSAVSMGNFIFNADVVNNLIKEIDSHTKANLNDIVLRKLINKNDIYAYDFGTNSIPGMSDEEKGYFINISNIDSYWKANMDFVNITPVFNLYNKSWPLKGRATSLPPAKFVFANKEQGCVGFATNSIISEGCIIYGGSVSRSILSPKVRINSFSHVENSILMDNSTIGRYSRIKNAVIDDSVNIPQDMTIGYDREEDEKYFYVTHSGIVVVTKEGIEKHNTQKNERFNDFNVFEAAFNKIYFTSSLHEVEI